MPPSVPPARSAIDESPALRVEPLIGLEWSQAIEMWGAEDATVPSETRRAWVHRAPEPQVMALYRTIRRSGTDVPAPWWLRALAAGNLSSRAEGFAVEDRVAKLLSARPGWVFVPWATEGSSGYWEYVPSERKLLEPGMPTTLILTDRHPGWIDILRVHVGETPDPVAVGGLPDLRANLARFESMGPA
ncbi:hypothetical protein [Actinophytocola xanthii]|uniref:Uncharacterized protein n=1 Tax=Actinophytocola xanthii TaxID=1912961 RepID=A0A1Q8CVL4_9PSEU|nr:hypothetical protein [Actinophytocola xanthii]OLF18391.1 hypothetical protein BU204_06760 [Actinophytocola xanthii]